MDVKLNFLHKNTDTADRTVFYCLLSCREADFISLFEESVGSLCSDKLYTLRFVFVDDWDADCSPWAANCNGRLFPGDGEQFLIRLIETIRSDNFTGSKYLVGYSLAGLFSLWSLYKTDLFSGCACCSGSLWYPGWMDFARENRILRSSSRIYLSLGGKESKVADQIISGIELNTNEQLKLLRKDAHVSSSVLEMNSGGHFADPYKRLAKGIYWLLST